MSTYESTEALRTELVRQRKSLGWVQEDLRERSGVSLNTIKNIENGRGTRPRLLDHVIRALRAGRIEYFGLDTKTLALLADMPEPVIQRAVDGKPIPVDSAIVIDEAIRGYEQGLADRSQRGVAEG